MTAYFNSLLPAVTDIGDSACLLAIAVSGSLYLFSRKAHRAALFLLGSYLLSALSIGLIKLFFISCQSYFHRFDINSPSGHAGLSASVFWAYWLLMRRHLPENRRFFPFLLLTLLIAAISVSRVSLHMHTVMEVWAGLGAGTIGVFITYFLILREKSTTPYDAYALALWGVVAGFAAHGMHMQAENFIHMLASHVKNHVPFCD